MFSQSNHLKLLDEPIYVQNEMSSLQQNCG
jgi:hypothetical protein